MEHNHEDGSRSSGWVGPDLPSVTGVVIGSTLFMAGGTLMLTVIGIPLGIVLFAAGLGLMLTPKERRG
jgi:hypothetical protein